MSPQIKTIEALTISGLRVRTNNASEMNPDTAKIGNLWQAFSSKLAPKLAPGTAIYGVYSNYESDHTDNFDVIVGRETSNDSSSENADIAKDMLADLHNTQINWQTVDVSAGTYAVFSATGDMPQTVIELWQSIWAYFAMQDCPHSRTYTTDFERYQQENTVEIYIAIA